MKLISTRRTKHGCDLRQSERQALVTTRFHTLRIIISLGRMCSEYIEMCSEHFEMCSENFEMCSENIEMCSEHFEMCSENIEMCSEHFEKCSENLKFVVRIL
jgi:uncharacterized protein Yka (UPF0111/DUF47 family)